MNLWSDWSVETSRDPSPCCVNGLMFTAHVVVLFVSYKEKLVYLARMKMLFTERCCLLAAISHIRDRLWWHFSDASYTLAVFDFSVPESLVSVIDWLFVVFALVNELALMVWHAIVICCRCHSPSSSDVTLSSGLAISESPLHSSTNWILLAFWQHPNSTSILEPH